MSFAIPQKSILDLKPFKKIKIKTSVTNSCFETTCITAKQVLVNDLKLRMSHKATSFKFHLTRNLISQAVATCIV